MRIKYIDYLKGIGMLLVIVGHCGIPSPWWNYIYMFHLPLFFFVSGMVFNSRKCDIPWKNYLQDLFRKYVKPYVIFSLLGLLITMSFPKVYGIEPSYYQLGVYVSGIFVGRGEFAWTGNWGAIWYLLATFWLLVLAYIFGKKHRMLIYGVLCVVAPITSVYLMNYFSWQYGNGWIIWNIGSALIAFPIFFLGNMFREMKQRLKNVPKIVFLLVSIVLLVVGFLIAKDNTGIVAFANNGYGDLERMYVGALCIPLGLALCFDALYDYSLVKLLGKPVEWIGRKTLLFLGIHGMTIPVVKLLVYKWFAYENWIITAVLVLIVDTLFIVVYEYLKDRIIQIVGE